MSIIANIVLNPIEATISLNSSPVSITITANLATTEISLNYQQARDAYQLAVEEGFVGTRAEWLESLQGSQGPQGPQGEAGAAGAPGADGEAGADGQNAQVQVLSLAEYLALTAEQQMDGTWYVIPRGD